ncbi:VOC family protein [Myroides fluvii]|uniref:VOC family protein n=1 Tax=Myroides fluvii TaxID=2572594 RepID=UPI00131CDE0B|nr:VOC family protein [Myroides fluvii]
MIKYSYTIMYVKHVEATVAFYESAFGFERKFITPEGDYAELISGETTLAFASADLAQSNLAKGYTAVSKEQVMGIELGFVVDNVTEALNKAIEAGATLYEPLKVKPWGQSVAYVIDCNGFLIELCTAMGG